MTHSEHDDPPESSLERLPPAKPGRYAIEGEIGRGGLGRVVRARDGVLDRPVALKELLDHDEETERRFVREAMITARLEHPGIVPVHDAARWPSGEPFIAMKLVSGRPLAELVREAKTLDARLALVPNVLAVSEAVAYAHEKRIIHRDIKPANVMIGSFGETILIDWGLTKDLDAQPETPSQRGAISGNHHGVTIAGAIMGTPAYMAPEQARGDAVDERVDVYAIGAMLYEVLSGSPPRGATTTQALIDDVIHRPPPPLVEKDPGIPSDLIAIVEKSMSPSADRRYRNAGELAADLKRFLTGQLVGARRYTRLERLARWAWKHRAIVALSTTVIVAAAILGTIAIRRVIEARDSAELAMHGAENARRAEAERADDLMIVQARALLGRDPTAAIAWLRGLSAETSRGSSARLLALDARLQGIADVIDPGLERVRAMAIGPNGAMLAAIGADGSVRWWPTDGTGGRAANAAGALAARMSDKTIAVQQQAGVVLYDVHSGQRLFADGSPVNAPFDYSAMAISADGRRWGAFGGDIWIGDFAARTKRRVSGIGYWAGFSPHGRYFAASTQAGEVFTVDLDHDDRVVMHGQNRNAARHLVFSANEAFVATTGGDLIVWELGTDKSKRLEGHEGAVWQVALSPDGTRAVSSGFDRTVRRWNLATGESSIVMRDVLTRGIQMAPDGVRVAFAVEQSLWIVDTDTLVRQELRGHRGPINDFAFTPDGHCVITASEDGTLRRWDLTMNAVQSVRGTMGGSKGFAMSKTGWLAIPGDHSDVRLRSFDGTTSRELGRVEGGMTSALFSPDGKMLALAGGNGTISIADLDSGTSKVIGSLAGAFMLRAFDGDGTLTGVSESGSVISFANGTRRELCGEIARAAVLDVSGRFVAASVRDTLTAFDRTGPVVALCDTSTGGVHLLRDHAASVRSLALGHHLPLLAVGLDDGSIKVWNLSTKTSRVIPSHAGTVLALAFSSDDALLASGGGDQEVHVHALHDGSRVTLKGAGSELVAVSFAPQDDLIAAASADGVARVFDLATRESRVLHGAIGVERVAFSPDGRWIVAASTSGAVKIFTDDAPRDPAALRKWIADQTKTEIESDGRLTGVRIAFE